MDGIATEPDDDGLIGAGDPAPFEVVNRDGAADLLLVCDHASRAVPAKLDRLGLGDPAFERHIAFDIGAAGVARRLAESLDAQLVLAGYSRLVIDVNRPIGHPDSIVEEIDGTPIPGNAGLDEADKRRRIRELFEPYHDAVNRALARLWERGTPPALFSVHSFSPGYGGTPRPWDIGVLWNRDPRIAVPLMEKLEALGLNVGDNEPYSGQQLAYTIDMHGGSAGLANCVIEINQDQVRDAQGVERWAGILVGAMAEILRAPGLHRVERF
ncbi:MAG: N-formylglutamate amidohydrolase [Magnetovibrio sp.]|nr:N-formylglutamate amidohydrolase [Magnetovibrio sp.]